MTDSQVTMTLFGSSPFCYLCSCGQYILLLFTVLLVQFSYGSWQLLFVATASAQAISWGTFCESQSLRRTLFLANAQTQLAEKKLVNKLLKIDKLSLRQVVSIAIVIASHEA